MMKGEIFLVVNVYRCHLTPSSSSVEGETGLWNLLKNSHNLRLRHI